MSGLVKGKEYDLDDSNVENIGSNMDRDLKKKAAATEKAWKNAGQKPGLQIWRIEDFEVKDWPKSQYGQFYRGDSYIILKTYKEADSEELNYDLHFWLGQESTQDEMGTAAYKTVELDTFLDDKPVQYREVEKFESKLFKKNFERITYLEGGVASGFNKVKTNEEDPPSLFELCGECEKDICFDEVPKPSWQSLHSYSAFILPIGKYIIRFNGSKCNKFEKYCANCYVGRQKSENPRRNKEIVIDGDKELNRMVANYLRQRKNDYQEMQEQHEQDCEHDHEQGKEQDHDDDNEDEDEDGQTNQIMELMVGFLGVPPEKFDVRKNKEEETVNKKKEVPCEERFVKKLLCVEHNKRTAKVDMEVVACGEDIACYKLDEKHSFILDKGREVFVYAGKKVDKRDKKNLMVDCNIYLCDKVNKNAPVMAVKSTDKFEEKMKA